jgi:flagellar motility protein MotE (MotC chaperone)
MKQAILDRIRLFPLLVIVASLALMVRLGEFATGFHQGVALAQQEVDADVPPMKDEDREEEAEHNSEHENTPLAYPAENLITEQKEEEETEKVEWTDATETDFQFSEVREELYRDLAARRKELEKRERTIQTQNALLDAGQKELEQKLRELIEIRNEIEGLLKEQSEEEKARLDSLVKIYETMKAKDAARIFDTLDIDVLITVISRMSVRKASPVIAEMNPERARTITILLARQRNLPTVSQ